MLTVGAGATQDLFGAAVSLSGNALVINPPGGGTAYIYERSGTAWTQAAILPVSPGRHVLDQNVAISNTTACVGAPGTNMLGNPSAGLARVYVGGPSSWSTEQTIAAPTAAALTLHADRSRN